MTTPETDRVSDQRIDRVVPLTTPAMLHHEICPWTTKLSSAVLTGRRAVGRVLDRTDDRLLVVVGPCSVHDPAAALDYAHRLRRGRRSARDDLLVVMRSTSRSHARRWAGRGLSTTPGWTAPAT
ncbi:hypothetical protein [Micromonospora sp. WMMA1363]|uniref:hypothetical protein n=1 Tax=Micromonospora sp. WMMA1363 TaxID=3053985 RepID=UPI00338D8EDA